MPQPRMKGVHRAESGISLNLCLGFVISKPACSLRKNTWGLGVFLLSLKTRLLRRKIWAHFLDNEWTSRKHTKNNLRIIIFRFLDQILIKL